MKGGWDRGRRDVRRLTEKGSELEEKQGSERRFTYTTAITMTNTTTTSTTVIGGGGVGVGTTGGGYRRRTPSSYPPLTCLTGTRILGTIAVR